MPPPNQTTPSSLLPLLTKVYQEALSKGSRILVSKEEFGHSREKGECDYVIIPEATAYKATKPAFLFRDPIRVFDSWKALGWLDINSFVISYTSLVSSVVFSFDVAICWEGHGMMANRNQGAVGDRWSNPPGSG